MGYIWLCGVIAFTLIAPTTASAAVDFDFDFTRGDGVKRDLVEDMFTFTDHGLSLAVTAEDDQVAQKHNGLGVFTGSGDGYAVDSDGDPETLVFTINKPFEHTSFVIEELRFERLNSPRKDKFNLIVDGRTVLSNFNPEQPWNGAGTWIVADTLSNQDRTVTDYFAITTVDPDALDKNGNKNNTSFRVAGLRAAVPDGGATLILLGASLLSGVMLRTWTT